MKKDSEEEMFDALTESCVNTDTANMGRGMSNDSNPEDIRRLVDIYFDPLVEGHAAAILLLIDVMPDRKNLEIVSATYGPEHYITTALKGALEELKPEPIPALPDGYAGYENL